MSVAAALFPSADCFRHDVRMSDWKRLGKYVVARRVELGQKHRSEFAAASSIDARILSDIEHGRRANYAPPTIAALELFLGWETGSVHRVVEGGDPQLRASDTAAVPQVEPAVPERGMSDEIEMIYASRSMTAEEKLRAIRRVLLLRQEIDQERGQADTAEPSITAENES